MKMEKTLQELENKTIVHAKKSNIYIRRDM